jgi:predicted membrane-bound mannosyltransferase
LAAAVASAIVVAAVFLSSLLTNPRGFLDGVLTYLPWLERAGGQSPHTHRWYFYLHRLACWHRDKGPWWSEGLILLLAAVGWIAALRPASGQRLLPDASRPFVRWLGFYGISLTAMYSIIPYKTPWCLLGFHHVFALLAGVGAVALIRVARARSIQAGIGLVLLAAAGQLAWQSDRASFELFADPTNPYVYAQTSSDIERLAQDAQQLARAAGEGDAVPVKVIWNDPFYWPLPWYLRRFTRVGYWSSMPDDPAAPIVIASAQLDRELTERLEATHLMTGYYDVRPGVLAQLWVRMDLWEAHLRRLGRL